jgi:hypothetical protein
MSNDLLDDLIKLFLLKEACAMLVIAILRVI